MSRLSRRAFIKTTATSVAAIPAVIQAAPSVRTANKSGSTKIVGSGDHVFEAHHDFYQLPGEFHWQITHNVAIDSNGHVYVIHEGDASKTDHPAIFVFDADGRYVKSFGKQFQGGGHGLEIRKEGSEEFLYVTAYQALKFIQKLTLGGEIVWTKFAPMESGRYAAGEATNPKKEWGRDRFMPTNYGFLADGSFFMADGYGSHAIHHYDIDGNYKKTIGKSGNADGEFNLPHGLCVDDRSGTELLAVADRANHRLQWLTVDGQHVRTQNDFILPANLEIQGNLMLVPELKARITLLDKDNNVAARLGGDPEWQAKVVADKNAMRRDPATWEDGQFIHPHDACFDADGNILVAEWVSTGRVSKLVRV